jgi:gliding motility-associated lipoprotein GldH
MKRNPRVAMIRRVSFACLTLLLFVLASCSKGEEYYRFHHIQHGKWYRDSSLLFTVDSAAFQLGIPYNLSIELSFNNAYPYQDFWLRVEHNLTADPAFHVDTLHVRVTDELDRWIGSGVGGLHQLSIAYPHVVRPTFRDSTTGYRVTVAHYMDDNPLKGVEKVGLKLVRQ